MFSDKENQEDPTFSQAGVFIDQDATNFMNGLEKHRFWEREKYL